MTTNTNAVELPLSYSGGEAVCYEAFSEYFREHRYSTTHAFWNTAWDTAMKHAQSQLTACRKELGEAQARVDDWAKTVKEISDREDELEARANRAEAAIAAKDEALRSCIIEGSINEGKDYYFDEALVKAALSSHGSNWTRPEVVEKLVEALSRISDGECTCYSPDCWCASAIAREALALVKKEGH